MKRNLPGAILFLVVILAVNLAYTPPGWGEGVRHTVEPGDTLWDICEKYYGDPGLWPKLWQMNPFVTNPHLLKTGDVITLWEGEPPRAPAPVETKTVKHVEASAQESPRDKGIDISGLANVKSMGMLSTQKAAPCGRIHSAENEKLLLSEGDVLYLEFDGREVRAGDTFAVYKSSGLLKNPVNRGRLGYVFTFLGRVAVREHVEKRLFKGELVEAYRDVRVGDTLIPYEPVSPCIRPLADTRALDTTIAAAEEEKLIIGPSTVVYLPVGETQKVQRGHLFEILKKREVRDSGPAAPKKIALPDNVLGRVLILEARSDTATGVVVELRENVTPGASLRSVTQLKSPRVLALLPECAL